MEKIAMILRKPPYGDINAAEAVRHALGAVTGEIKVSLLLLDGGVLLSQKGQDETGTGFTNLGSALKDCIDMGVGVYASRLSLKDNSLKEENVMDGVQIINESEVASILQEAEHTMIF